MKYRKKPVEIEAELAKPEQFKLICPKCGADRTKEDCKGERLQCGVMGQAHLTKPEHGLKHGDKVSLTVDDVGQIHVSPEQEPWLWIRKKYDFQGAWISNRLPQDPENWDAVYKAPPRKEWVGLTDDEIKNILDCGRGGLVDIKKAEAKLRNKNG